MAAVLEFDTYDRLPQIKCPVMIVHGDQDMLIPPANAEVLLSRMPQAEVFMIPNAGYSYGAADPVGIHQRIVNWLKT
jgi:pimeloyl-ACP methyl ester carboxylesterase